MFNQILQGKQRLEASSKNIDFMQSLGSQVLAASVLDLTSFGMKERIGLLMV